MLSSTQIKIKACEQMIKYFIEKKQILIAIAAVSSCVIGTTILCYPKFAASIHSAKWMPNGLSHNLPTILFILGVLLGGLTYYLYWSNKRKHYKKVNNKIFVYADRLASTPNQQIGSIPDYYGEIWSTYLTHYPALWPLYESFFSHPLSTNENCITIINLALNMLPYAHTIKDKRPEKEIKDQIKTIVTFLNIIEQILLKLADENQPLTEQEEKNLNTQFGTANQVAEKQTSLQQLIELVKKSSQSEQNNKQNLAKAANKIDVKNLNRKFPDLARVSMKYIATTLKNALITISNQNMYTSITSKKQRQADQFNLGLNQAATTLKEPKFKINVHGKMLPLTAALLKLQVGNNTDQTDQLERELKLRIALIDMIKEDANRKLKTRFKT